ncbi:hypothetical protein ZIOFF_047672 [Zingiber officinale]|uniref:HORMA domain-containing protein n=1 Tax=Zingiber officinale TaxID=94328 RepID=A0A8J5KQX8_ZINOF|nr:hypothetical protein ZIOFF_047672 [Zingiber officinale]
MVVAQRVKEAEITEQDSLLLLERICTFDCGSEDSFGSVALLIRSEFPDSSFGNANDMKIKKLMPMDAESRRLIDWMEKGVYDALQKKYLKTLTFSICEELGGPMIEEYAFSFNYGSSDGEEVCMKLSHNGNKKNGATFKSNMNDVTPDQMRSSACKMIRTLVSLMRTLDQMPEEPEDYEPPFFRKCSENEPACTWAKTPLKMEVGSVNSRHLLFSLKVKSILDPCEDENYGHAEDEEVSLGDDSVQGNDSSSDSEVRPSLADQFFVAPTGKKHPPAENGTISNDETQDAAHEDEQASRVRNWIYMRHTSKIDLIDILSDFPDISVALIEDIVEKLVKEGLLTRVRKDTYTINKEINCKTSTVKEENDVQDVKIVEKVSKNSQDYMYMKALYYALPMDYVSISKLQSKLEGEANQSTVRKLVDRMEQEGYIKNTGNRRLGKRVIHSESSNRKLLEVKKILEQKMMETDANCQMLDTTVAEFPLQDINMNDNSTFGGLHSVGSDLTRTQVKSKQLQSGPLNSDQTGPSKDQERGNSPTRRPVPIASLESAVARERPKNVATGPGDDSQSIHDKRLRKASTVDEPILQYVKRQKSEA